MCKWGETKRLSILRPVGSVKMIDVDECIYDLISVLNLGGIFTAASCCGHGKRPGRIILESGRELFLAADYEEGTKIDKIFNNAGYEPIN